ncbi:calnexin [Rhagoletis pomonella]|uniref:calnexin n=1 Tax=Rhagoletis pomonella TaxID=28610 RepID=UPI001784D813|nr:calnexin [Rhagoletis pomonella]XP_036323041.1 calnexin [Rhagoletis pomonella]
MRFKNNLGLHLCSLLIILLLAISPIVRSEVEQDFADDAEEDGKVEDVQDDGELEEIVYESPVYDQNKFYFADHFDDIAESTKRWVKSQAKKDDIAEEIAKYDGNWVWEAPQRIVSKKDIGLVLKSKAKHAAIASKLNKPFTFKEDNPLVVQYEVTMQEGQECGGSYIKLLSHGKHTEDLTKFNDKTPYTIMFGPDKCGSDIKLHFIFRHVNPINGSIEEKHCKKPKDRLEEPFKDKLPHLYQLVLRPDNTFEISVDNKIVNQGSLLSEFTPSVNPPREIDDPEDKKPKDWDEREKIPDPTAKKPEDWDDDAPPQIPDPSAVMPDGWLEDEPQMIPDPTAAKPADWDTEMDGEWEAPLIDNPVCEKATGCGEWKAPLIQNKEYKGKWRAPLIDNPNYQGKWAARKIPNPDFFEDLTPFKMTPISAVGLELWSMSDNILFDNLIIVDDIELARDFAAKTFDIKRKYIDKESETFFNKIVTFFTEASWVWRVAMVIAGATPLSFTLYRLFKKSGSKESSSDAGAKKTDAVQPDDVADNSGGTAETAVASSSNATQNSSPKTKKSDLDVKDEAGDDTATPTAAAANASSDQKDSQDDDAEEAEAEEATTKTVRKRRVPKDQS